LTLLNSGPGGRRFKSSLPDHSFQVHQQHFWIFVYSAVVDFVDGQSYEVNARAILQCLRRVETWHVPRSSSITTGEST
jgi:hypothetical protein